MPLYELSMIGVSFQFLMDIWIVSGVGVITGRSSINSHIFTLCSCVESSLRFPSRGGFVKSKVWKFGMSLH